MDDRFRFDDQDFFEADPVRYAKALGVRGVAAYRKAVARRGQTGEDSFALKYAQERLAVLDGDTGAIIRLLGGDLTHPYQFLRVTNAMTELGRDEDVLAWASRGIKETSGWQVGQLYDLAADVLTRCGDAAGIFSLRRDQHSRMASATTYGILKKAAGELGTWDQQRPEATAVLARRDPGGLVDALLTDGDQEAAWRVTLDNPGTDLGEHRWVRLAEARADAHPGDALDVYLRIADTQLETAGRASYQRAAVTLKKAARAAHSAGRDDEFAAHLAALRDHHRRRPTLLSVLDKANLG